VVFVFFFQAEDGIRDFHVTGVQTCALPISSERCERSGASVSVTVSSRMARVSDSVQAGDWAGATPARARTATERSSRRAGIGARSEERRVGKEGRGRWWRA